MGRNEFYWNETTKKYDRTRMKVAEDAAKKFIDNYAKVGTASNVLRGLAIVKFGTNATRVQNWINVAAPGNAIIAKNSISNLSNSDVGAGTFLQGGLRYAQNLLGTVNTYFTKAASTTNVHVIVISDGGPTAYNTNTTNNNFSLSSGIMNSNAGSTNNVVRGEGTWNNDIIPPTYTASVNRNDSAINSNNPNGWKSSTTAATTAATALKNSTRRPKVHTVGFTTGNYNINNMEYWAYHISNNDRLSVMDLLKTISSSGSVYDAGDEITLNFAFDTIVGVISADAWYVDDFMGMYIKYDGPVDADKTNIEEGNNSFRWDLTKEPHSKDENGWYSYSFTYKIILDNMADNFPFYTDLKTNSSTKLSYVIKNNNVVSSLKEAIFISPEVQGLYGDIEFIKEDDEGNPVSGAEFKLLYNGKIISTGESIYNKDTEIAMVKFENIPSGHEYILIESKLDGYFENTIEYIIDVSYGHTRYDDRMSFGVNKYGIVNTKIPDPPEPPKPKGEITIEKTVDGTPFAEWIAEWVDETVKNPLELLSGIKFELYKATIGADGKLSYNKTTDIVDELEFSLSGLIYFPADVKLEGWYAIKESFDQGSLADRTFVEVDPLYIYFYNDKIIGGIGVEFDYDALYKITYSLSGMLNLNYIGLNNDGEIFYIGVINSKTNVEYVSFCAHAGSVRFAGDNHLKECTGYMCAKSGREIEGFNYEKFLAAFNYIEDKYGDLNKRLITQVVVWSILDAINVNTLKTSNNLTIDEINAIKDVMAHLNYAPEEPSIIDVVYMVCENPEHDFLYCQPQIVPVYGESVEVVFDNQSKKEPTGSDKGILDIKANLLEEYRNKYHKLVYKKYSYDTLVCSANKLNNSEIPNEVTGGFLNNGMPYLKIPLNIIPLKLTDPIEDAKINGLKFKIAESNKSGGNSINVNWNTPINKYFYLKREGNNIVLTSDLPGFGYLLSDQEFNGNPTSQIKHDEVSKKAIPNQAITKQYVYLFFHIGGASWYSDEVIGCTFDYDGPIETRAFSDNANIISVKVLNGSIPIYEGRLGKTRELEVDNGYVVQLYVNGVPYRTLNHVEVKANETLVCDFGDVIVNSGKPIFNVICDRCNK